MAVHPRRWPDGRGGVRPGAAAHVSHKQSFVRPFRAKSQRTCVGLCTGTIGSKVGAGRTAELCLPTPPSEPDVPLSGHPALPGLATSRLRGHRFSFITAASFTGNTRTSPGDPRLIVCRRLIPCRPSPCTRLSRAPTTMAAPTPIRFTGGLHPSPYGPPTFMVMGSAEVFRW
jgi:hypothetical protein